MHACYMAGCTYIHELIYIYSCCGEHICSSSIIHFAVGASADGLMKLAWPLGTKTEMESVLVKHRLTWREKAISISPLSHFKQFNLYKVCHANYSSGALYTEILEAGSDVMIDSSGQGSIYYDVMSCRHGNVIRTEPRPNSVYLLNARYLSVYT